MANFRTHITVATAGGMLMAYAGWQAEWWPSTQAVLIVALVAFGGILPDIDADRSRSIRLIFNLLSVPSLVLGVMLLESWLTPGMLLVACGGIYFCVRYLAGILFSKLTVHRGIWHSLLAAGLCSLLTAALSYHLLFQPPWLAWSHGAAVLLGFVIHLGLDEIYSVDLEGARLKRSFGTALKLGDSRRPMSNLLMLIATLTLLPWAPPWSVLVELMHQGSLLWR
ncbi:LexA-binding, inner membrane-associated putative hydrolase [Vreelandella songnenensis]|uniref:LexA-binding, inner membrane-associated putative hydrolase n=1 Tax=Vreelandella songnenensis TaxID=1176243 RepID=A0A2T0ULN4_9GAMM|nr:metal-dependent hydrolase [Halomonas songnenensis]PRY58841.1 LexA-binding, inner membrane-associated putative hydrolase [Halomonas songnenensis]